MNDELYRQAAQLLRRSRRAVALTGAGISTPSGIPDFRSRGTGLWERVDPMRVASIQGLISDPAAFYEWFSPTAGQIYAAEPNAAHHALVELEQRDILRTIVTQNIDGLHQKAGSGRVLELHGNVQTARCLGCRQQSPARPLLERFLAERQPPRCAQCGGLVKPEVVLFGETLPVQTLVEAQEEIVDSDLLLVVGSSLSVVPAAELPWLAVQSAIPIIICNIGDTWADRHAACILAEDVSQSLPRLLEGL